MEYRIRLIGRNRSYIILQIQLTLVIVSKFLGFSFSSLKDKFELTFKMKDESYNNNEYLIGITQEINISS